MSGLLDASAQLILPNQDRRHNNLTQAIARPTCFADAMSSLAPQRKDQPAIQIAGERADGLPVAKPSISSENARRFMESSFPILALPRPIL